MTSEEPPDAVLWRRAHRASLMEPADGCPDDETLAALAMAELQGEERQRVADHVVTCRRCVDAYRTLLDLDRAAGGGARRAGHARWRLAGWAAAALVAGVVVWSVSDRVPPADEPVLRGTLSTGAGVVVPANGSRLAQPPARLEWASEADAAIYRVVIYDRESVPLWQSERLSMPSLELPAELRRRLTVGGTYYWRVRIESDRGPSATPLYRFVVAP